MISARSTQDIITQNTKSVSWSRCRLWGWNYYYGNTNTIFTFL